MQLGLIKHYIPWLTRPDLAMNLVIVADVWHMMPFVALILQAALAGLPVELDEAAAVDGANCLAALLEHPAATAAPGHPGGAHRAHRGCLPRLRHRLHHHQRRTGFQHDDDHLLDLPELILVWQTGDRRRTVILDLILHHHHGNCLYSNLIPAGGEPVNATRKFLNKLLTSALIVPVLVFIFFPLLWLFSCQPLHPGGAVTPSRRTGSRITPRSKTIWISSSPAWPLRPYRAPLPYR